MGIDTEYVRQELANIEYDIKQAARKNKSYTIIFHDPHYKKYKKDCQEIINTLKKNGYEIKHMNKAWSCHW